MKAEENIFDMEKHFIYIVNHMRTLGKTFSYEDLTKKVFRCLNTLGNLKLLRFMNLNIYIHGFDYLVLKISGIWNGTKKLTKNEEDSKKKKSPTLKFIEAKKIWS